MLKSVLCFFLISGLIYSSENALTVALNVKELPTVYLHEFADCKSGLDKSYLKQLESVLRFDLDRSGRMHALPNAVAFSTQANQEKGLRSYDIVSWKKLNVSYVVKAEISQGMMTLTALDTMKGTVKGMERIFLTGILSEDRQVMHRLADSLNETFFAALGIAQSRILYTVRMRNQNDPSKWVTEVWQSDYDGGNAKQITSDNSLNMTPAFIPPEKGFRSSHFLYVSYKLGQPKIFTASISEGVGKRLIFLRGDQITPAISPKKDKVVFISDAMGNPDVFIQNFSIHKGTYGKPHCIFSSPEGAQGCPAFNRDGTQVAFVSNKDGNPRIYVTSLSTPKSPPLMLTKRNSENTCPAWSPDGTKLAYCAVTKGVRQIWIYDFSTQKEQQLTDTSGNKENPSWAPNSSHLIYNSSGPNTSELFLVDIYKKDPIQVTRGPGEKRFPAWEPFPYDVMKQTTAKERIL